jgi:Ca2+-binding RTX toxin-like protein
VHGAGTFNTVVELDQGVSLTLGTSTPVASNVQELVLAGGTNVADFHTAAGSVYLYGAAGNDTLFGGIHNDFLFGGAGSNTFQFQQGWGQDTIMDWTSGTNNIIDLTALGALGVHTLNDISQSTASGSDVITSSHTGANSITLHGFASTLGSGGFHFG